jgi:hypothetical protein
MTGYILFMHDGPLYVEATSITKAIEEVRKALKDRYTIPAENWLKGNHALLQLKPINGRVIFQHVLYPIDHFRHDGGRRG